MRYTVLKNTVANGQPVRAGSVIELTGSEAHALMGYGRIAPYDDAGIVNNAVDPVEHRDPVVRRGRKRRDVA